MSEKSEALRLADLLEKMPLGECDEQAAAELRRLSAVEAQRDALLGVLHAIVRRVNDAASYRMGSDIDALARAAIRALGERDWKAVANEAQKHFDAELKRYEGGKE